MAFRGTFDYSLDAKSRLTLPAKFRASLSGDVVLARGRGQRCVTIQSAEDFDAFMDSALADLHPLAPERDRIERWLSASAFPTKIDAAGRVMVPPRLMEHAGLKKDVVVAGVGSRLEVWDRDAWSAEDDAIDFTELTARFGHPA
jgi:MraZ protein